MHRPKLLTKDEVRRIASRVVGLGVEKDGTVFCCAHCAKQEGVTQLRDHA